MKVRMRMSKVILYGIGRGYVLAVVSAWLTFWYTSKLWGLLAWVWLDPATTDGIADPESGPAQK